MNRRTLLIALFIIAVAAGSTWLSRQTRQEAKQAVTSSAPDYFINNFAATELGADGRPVQRLEAAELSHFPNQEAFIREPHLIVYQKDDVPLELTARQAQVRDNGNTVRLEGGVHAFRSGPDATDIVTDYLQISPQRRFAETAAPVTITNAQGRLDAVGMQLDLANQRVILKSQVRGTYDQ